ncbi:class I SAM-dependent methyltransferase [Lachnospiraceae bacterium ZAX-1]
MENVYLKYYKQHHISPVAQDISDIGLHYRKREKLYRQLGLPAIAFQNATILEVGPGSGYNSLFFFQLGGYLDLVEPNPKGFADITALFSKCEISPNQYTLHACMAEDFKPDKTYDIIIAEGFLTHVDNGNEIIARLQKWVKPGGVIVVTCSDVVSLFVEQMYRLAAHALTKDIEAYNDKVNVCAEFFQKGMKHLGGMSRSIEDWVRDNMFNPAFNSETIIDIEKMIGLFGTDFEVLGSSQKIFEDYSWYKDLAFEERENCISQYRKKQHNFLMAGIAGTVWSEEENVKLRDIILKIRRNAITYEIDFNETHLINIQKLLEEIIASDFRIDGKINLFLAECIGILDDVLHNIALVGEKYTMFGKVTGRGLQYLSMVKDYKIKQIDL